MKAIELLGYAKRSLDEFWFPDLNSATKFGDEAIEEIKQLEAENERLKDKLSLYQRSEFEQLKAENEQLKGEKPIPFAWWKDSPIMAQRVMERIINKNKRIKIQFDCLSKLVILDAPELWENYLTDIKQSLQAQPEDGQLKIGDKVYCCRSSIQGEYVLAGIYDKVCWIRRPHQDEIVTLREISKPKTQPEKGD
jgi:hypothetical protein